MPSQKPHRKSRYGCDHCRRRRVKCDEQGPPCDNCVLRRLENCTYSRIPPSRLLASLRQAQNLARQFPGTSSPLSTSHSDSHVEDLELMHQFATETYVSLCVNDSESHIWKTLIPRLALEHRYLMNGILALASIHIATTLEKHLTSRYIATGVQYYTLSLEPFRSAIDHITPQNCNAVFAHSVVLVAINMALPQLTGAEGKPATAGPDTSGITTPTRITRPCMLDHIITIFELLQGVKRILAAGHSWIDLKLFSRGEFWKPDDPVSAATVLAPTTNVALSRLEALNDYESRLPGREGLASYYRVNRAAISHLRHCFVKFARSPDPAPVLGWLGAADKTFVDSLQRRETFPLLVLTYWGVLLDGLDGRRWWARNAGQALISEILVTQNGSSRDILGRNVEWENCIAWVKGCLRYPNVD